MDAQTDGLDFDLPERPFSPTAADVSHMDKRNQELQKQVRGTVIFFCQLVQKTGKI